MLVLFGMSSERGPTGILFVAIAICELSLISLFILYLCMKIPGLYSMCILFVYLFIYRVLQH